MKKGSFQWMKSLNRAIILNKIRTDGPISRAKIAKETKLTPPTVSSLVNELIETELIIESVLGESLGGRKPTMLIINSKRFHIVGVDIGPKMIRTVLIDLAGDAIIKQQTAIPAPINKEDLLHLLKITITELLNEHADKEVIGIGIGMHGAVDVNSGTSIFAPNLNLRDIPLKAELEAEFDILVKVDNDVRAMAFGEYWLMSGQTNENMVTVNIGHGVGAGIVINGQLFHGDHNLAGEIGHMTIDFSGGKLCSCGNHGCWQTLVSGPAIAEYSIERIKETRATSLHTFMNNRVEHLDGKAVYEAALLGDKLAIEVLLQTGEYIGIGLTNVIHMLNPTKIIIGGGVSNASTFILPIIRETIAKRGLTKQAKETEILCSKQGIYGAAMGAAALVLGDIFEG